jgi:LysM repeat protein
MKHFLALSICVAISFSLFGQAQTLPKFPGAPYKKVRAYKIGTATPTVKTGYAVPSEQVSVLLSVLNDASTYGADIYSSKGAQEEIVFFGAMDTIVARVKFCSACNAVFASPGIPAQRYHTLKGLSVHGSRIIFDVVGDIREHLPPPVNAPVAANVNPGAATKGHTVVSGDTWSILAKKYGITLEQLAAANGQKMGAFQPLSVGNVVKIPKANAMAAAKARGIKTYTVGKGDTLFSIAKKVNTTVEVIKSLNSLGANGLSEGQVLKVPK